MMPIRSLLAISLIFLSTASFGQEFDLEERFDQAHTLDFLEVTIAQAGCTPICGTPTCCIAFQQRIVTHVGEQRFDEFSQHVQSFGFSVTEMIAAAATDSGLYDQMKLKPVTDTNIAASKAHELMIGAEALGADLSCSACCYPCGGRTCCGGCWSFKN